MKADVVVGLQYGDEAKGKVSHLLCKNRNYTHTMRFNGGCNAGHTVYHEKKKYITHHLPVGVFYNIKSIIGSGCVVNLEQFFKELNELRVVNSQIEDVVKIAKNTHIITPEHIKEELQEGRLGTTKRGNGPAYRDKYNRSGMRAESHPELQKYLIDIIEELNKKINKKRFDTYLLCEGAQAFGIDIDWGDYPYVTSSHCTVAGALLNGIMPQTLNEIWGVAKIYETYVGTKKFQPNEKIFEQIAQLGEEYGATTGRLRQCNWLNWNTLERAILANGVTNLVFNKMDVLREINVWKIIHNGEIRDFNTEHEMKWWIYSKINVLNENFLYHKPILSQNVHFSSKKDSLA